ncbi:MAG TPA: DinB family protein [Dehalococcoidia bacterium]|nr:DinB family protein [Dehalococcoidia bacterium]
MPSLTMVHEMLDYPYWVRDRVLRRLEGMPVEVYLGDAGLDHGSIHRTLLHHLRAENNWRCRIEGQALSETKAAGLRELGEAWRAEEARWRALIGQLSETDLERPVTYRFASGEEHTDRLWQLVMHVFSHGVQHLGEVALAMTRYGFSPGDMDYMEYVHPAS